MIEHEFLMAGQLITVICLLFIGIRAIVGGIAYEYDYPAQRFIQTWFFRTYKRYFYKYISFELDFNEDEVIYICGRHNDINCLYYKGDLRNIIIPFRELMDKVVITWKERLLGNFFIYKHIHEYILLDSINNNSIMVMIPNRSSRTDRYHRLVLPIDFVMDLHLYTNKIPLTLKERITGKFSYVYYKN